MRVATAEAMVALGQELGRELPEGSVLCLYGDLGAGKTTLTRGVVWGATGSPEIHVTSPTFTYLNCYEGERRVYHFDLYRLEHPEQFFSMGFEEFLGEEGICCIEWPDRIEGYLPEGALQVRISHLPEGREVEIE